ncbi:MAG TPA: iron-containing alcohol dehydrogenase [Candidatus Latescibacteria bacterium]|nr:iron-containing alcohol dehydrogenase [Candidatus Latescibacterota bacterium]
MKPFNYHQPTEIRFGRGRLKEIPSSVARLGGRCLLVTVPDAPEFGGLFGKVKGLLAAAKIPTAHFSGVIPNPTTAVVTAGARMARDFKADVVLGLGGGSSMDTAKAIAVEATHAGTAWDYLFFREKQPTDKTLPVVAVTTTSGTGSHVTQVAVVTNPAEKNKSALYHALLYPRTSIVDPELMLTVPTGVTAATGFDVFAHAFESFINPGGSPYTDMMALEALTIVSKALPAAVKNGRDLEARERMAWADTLAGLCIANSGVTLPHGIGMAIGGLYPHISHGEALAVVYPAILRYSYRAAPAKFASVGRIMDKKLGAETERKAARMSCTTIERFIRRIGLDRKLHELHVPEEELAALALQSLVLPDYRNHPRVATLEEVSRILSESH